MAKYLYGAAVQGIQSFIFETNKLKEIVGASQLVENINEKEFKVFCNDEANHTLNEDNIIINAAGNIKYIFEKKEDCEKVVLGFPKHISNYAPGITISQAVVKLDGTLTQGDINCLEQKLKTQRNKAEMPVDIGFMGLERARRTGKVASEKTPTKKGEFEIIDSGTYKKIKLREEDTLSLYNKFTRNDIKPNVVPFDISEITGIEENSWLAIVHIDGNGLGNILQNLAEQIDNNNEDELKNAFKTFSEKLELATTEAAKNTFEEIVEPKFNKGNLKYPFRPVVLGGDDVTVIIRADLAYEFTTKFLKEFEKQTEDHFTDLNKYDIVKLTACGGIAYIKSSYPFHYGVHLAESLVKKAKDLSKLKVPQEKGKPVPSSLAFYKVQSSFTEDLGDMIKRTHCIQGRKDFFYGPYLMDEKTGFHSVNELDDLLKIMDEKFVSKNSKGISKLRQWISELYKDEAKAEFMLNRIESVNNEFFKNLKLEKEKTSKESILLDLIQLHTFKNLYNDN